MLKVAREWKNNVRPFLNATIRSLNPPSLTKVITWGVKIGQLADTYNVTAKGFALGARTHNLAYNAGQVIEAIDDLKTVFGIEGTDIRLTINDVADMAAASPC